MTYQNKENNCKYFEWIYNRITVTAVKENGNILENTSSGNERSSTSNLNLKIRDFAFHPAGKIESDLSDDVET